MAAEVWSRLRAFWRAAAGQPAALRRSPFLSTVGKEPLLTTATVIPLHCHRSAACYCRPGWTIGEASARKAGARGIVVIPTTSWMYIMRSSADSAANLAHRLDIVRQNLRTLMAHGAHIVMGSDRFGLTTTVERAMMRALRVWDDRALLKMWTETTSQSMFPRRLIGRLTDGYEASFVVLGGNPLDDLSALSDIGLRVKQGCLVSLAAR